MKCKYCQQECRPIVQGLLPNGLHENRLSHCDSCNVGYFKGFHVLYCTIDNRHYSVSYMDDHPDHWTSVYQNDIVLSSGTIIYDIVLSFKFYVKFTPQNFKEKLKLYLLFS